jgi:glucosamine--fructose-6-phosphate aminotransferase (isomerizing)
MSASPTVAPAPGAAMEREILEQPAAWRRLIAQPDAIHETVELIRRWDPAFILFIARGTSDHAALYGKYLAEIRCGLPAGSWSPSTTTVYGAEPRLGRCLVIAVSQSGGSPDLVQSLEAARAAGALTLAITNAPGSALAQAAELSIDVRAGEELAVAATKSYTAELLALAMLFDGLSARPAGGFDELPEHGEAVLADPDVWGAVDRAAERFSGDRFVLTGRGYASATAHEGALKLMETCYVSASGFSGADLVHGPMAMVAAGVAGIVVASPGLGGRAMEPVLERLRGSGSSLLLIGPRDPRPSELAVPLPPEVPEHLMPILEIVPLQRLAMTIARRRGMDPDRPRGLLKVTQTI